MFTPTVSYQNFNGIIGVTESTVAATYPNTFSFSWPADLVIEKNIPNVGSNRWTTRLTANFSALDSTSTNAEDTTVTNDFNRTSQATIIQGTVGVASQTLGYGWTRGTGFMDIATYRGNNTARTISHNLGAVPELMIIKNRTTAGQNWPVYVSSLGANNRLFLNTTDISAADATMWNSTAPTSTVFSIGTNANLNTNLAYCVAILFATLPGVSKVGSYTGTGALKAIDCGFNGGNRTIVMIKRTDVAGDWYVFDTTQGMSSGADPYWLMNSTAAQVTGTNYINNTTTGFEVTAAASTTVNVNGGTYIFLAIV
jgi:hypothetical protein